MRRLDGRRLTLNVYTGTATANSPTADALKMLASWAATQDLMEEPLATTEQT